MEERQYVEQIFRLTFKRDAGILYTRSAQPGRITQLVDRVLKRLGDVTFKLSTLTRMRINLADVEPVLAEITAAVGELRQNKAFNDRLNELDELNPRDIIVERVEEDTDYANPVTKEMIEATDALIHATVENKCPNSSEEEDSDDEYLAEVTPAIKKMRMLQGKRVSLTEKEIDAVRYEILKDAATGVFDIVGDAWNKKFDKFLKTQAACRAAAAQEVLDSVGKVRGGTKRRKSKKKRRTKRLESFMYFVK